MKSRAPFLIVLSCLLLPLDAQCVGVPNLHLKDLEANSELIVIGEVTTIKTVGSAPPIDFRGQELQADAYSAIMAVRRTVKGFASGQIDIHYVLPLSFVGYRGLQAGTRMVFLRRRQDHYVPVSAYYSDFPAVLSSPPTKDLPSNVGDYTANVLREMLSVIASSSTSTEQKWEILRIDYAFPNSKEVLDAFREGLANTKEPNLRQRLQGELVSMGDIIELPHVIDLLLTNTATPDQRIWLLYVVENRVKDSRAIPNLQPLLGSGDTRLREAAVEALWHVADPAALPDLAAALRDPDEQVRFYAVRALSDIANEPGWGGPGESQFRDHEQEYLAHWQKWSSAQMQR